MDRGVLGMFSGSSGLARLAFQRGGEVAVLCIHDVDYRATGRRIVQTRNPAVLLAAVERQVGMASAAAVLDAAIEVLQLVES
jgi:hypothetical protein